VGYLLGLRGRYDLLLLDKPRTPAPGTLHYLERLL
jgi:hypothetical protein